jgi:hypothetical protein
MQSGNGPRGPLVYCAYEYSRVQFSDYCSDLFPNRSVPDDPGGRLNMARSRSRMIEARAADADRLILGFQLTPNHQYPPHENQRIQNKPSK